MRTKLFLAFFMVILVALVSNLIFKGLITSDFEEYVGGVSEDRLYWVLASVEGSHHDETGWDAVALRHYLHWAAIMGYEVSVEGLDGTPIMATREAIAGISPSMGRRLAAIVSMEPLEQEYEYYPLYAGGREIGALMVRPLRRMDHLHDKERMFKGRGATFLVISFLIAGGGALFLSVVFSVFLTGPLRRLGDAARAVAGGDLSVRVEQGRGRDEIGALSGAFNGMVEALERNERLRRRLTANVAHELRTPIAVMRAHAEAMADGVIPCGEDQLRVIALETRRLTTLVEGIEDITKAEEGFFRPARYEDVRLGDFLRGIGQGLEGLMMAGAIEAAYEGPEDLVVRTDAGKLETIVRNIIGNAIKHSGRGGRVRIAWGLQGAEFRISVSDTGEGIAEGDLERVFDRFFKGERSDGIGLGLAIARELTEVLGGTIGVVSAPGKGAEFTVRMPIQDA